VFAAVGAGAASTRLELTVAGSEPVSVPFLPTKLSAARLDRSGAECKAPAGEVADAEPALTGFGAGAAGEFKFTET